MPLFHSLSPIPPIPISTSTLHSPHIPRPFNIVYVCISFNLSLSGEARCFPSVARVLYVFYLYMILNAFFFKTIIVSTLFAKRFTNDKTGLRIFPWSVGIYGRWKAGTSTLRIFISVNLSTQTTMSRPRPMRSALMKNWFAVEVRIISL